MRATCRPRDGGGDLRRWLTRRSTRSSSPSRTCSRRLPSSPMVDAGSYGRMAARYMARWQPSAYAAIPAEDLESYFHQRDEEITEAILNRAHSLRPPSSLQQSNYLEYVGQMNMARLMAEEQVLAEMVYLPPEAGLESEGDEPATDETGAFIDPEWKSPRLATISDADWEYQQGRRMVAETDEDYQAERRQERTQD